MRSLARLFSSSRRAPPRAASNPWGIEHLSEGFGLHHLRSAEPDAIGLMPRASPIRVKCFADDVESSKAAMTRPM
jgi:hypothetical protein